ncbi:MAG: phosphatase PAP2 family protein [Acidimicrobiia bacterium]|nr:phosphatase PAP2 family protein [Acidimicrobiia bacterium]
MTDRLAVRLTAWRTRWRSLPGGRTLRDGRRIYWWAEVVAILAFYFVYSAIRNADAEHTTQAFHNAVKIVDLERALRLYHEQLLQGWALHFTPLIVAMNYFYGSLHFVVTIGAGVYLFARWSDDYPFWRNTLAIATALALIGFRYWPLMPPRLLPDSYGYVDTLARYPTFWSFNSGAVAKLSNQYAAMPSVHCAWALFCACVFVPRVRATWAKVLAGLYPAATVVVIVLTANHYFLDAVGGFAILGLGYLASRVVTRAGRGPAAENPAVPVSRPAGAATTGSGR